MTKEQEQWQTPRRLAKQMHDLAGELRQSSTKSEDMLWAALRNRQLKGRKFRRQTPIGAYVFDFYCAEEKLAIEVDGAVHEGQQAEDRLRQETIEALGITFIRVSAVEVETKLESVLGKLKDCFSQSPSKSDRLSSIQDTVTLPSPRLRGRGVGGEG